MVGFSTFKAIAGRILPVELREGRVVQKFVSLGCIELLTGSIRFCWSITFSFIAAFVHKKRFLLLLLLYVFHPSFTSGTVSPRFAPLSDSQAEGIFSLYTASVAAMFGADKRRAAGGLLGGSIQAPADGAVIMSRLASEGREEGLHAGGFLCCPLQAVRPDGSEAPQIKASLTREWPALLRKCPRLFPSTLCSGLSLMCLPVPPSDCLVTGGSGPKNTVCVRNWHKVTKEPEEPEDVRRTIEEGRKRKQFAH